MQNTGSNQKPSPPANFESGFIESVDRKETRAGKPMLTIKINQKDVSFFEETDVQKEIAIGDQVQFSCLQKGQYWNGKGLQLVRKGSPNDQTSLPPKKVVVNASPLDKPNNNSKNISPAPASKTPINHASLNSGRFSLQIHNLTADQLIQLYDQLQAEGQSEPAFLGQISNQIRYARIEEMLRELISLSEINN